MLTYRLILVVLQYVIPLCVITWAYARMAHALWGNRAPGNAEDARDAALMKNKKKVSKIPTLTLEDTSRGTGELYPSEGKGAKYLTDVTLKILSSLLSHEKRTFNCAGSLKTNFKSDRSRSLKSDFRGDMVFVNVLAAICCRCKKIH